MVGRLQTGVRDDEPTAVEDQVGDQVATERLHPLAELLGLVGELGQRLGQPVGDLDVATGQRTYQLVFVVARHGQRVARGDHPHDQAQHPRRVGSPVDQIADEHGLATIGRYGIDRPPVAVPHDGVPESFQQRLELGPAAMDVADDVERAGFVPVVVEQPLPDDPGVRDLLDPAQHVYLAEPLARQTPQRPAQLVALAAYHVVAESPVRPGRVALQTHLLRYVQHDRDR